MVLAFAARRLRQLLMLYAELATAIETGADERRRDLLVKRVAQLMLRRTRGQVLQELPPRTDIDRPHVPLHRGKRSFTKWCEAAMDKRVRKAIRAKALAQSQIIVLDAL